MSLSNLPHGDRTLRSPEQVKADFRRRGVAFADWARENNFSVATVYQVLAGQRKCLRGQSHQIAQRLGMK